MIRIAVCDDTQQDLHNLALMTNDYFTENSIDVEVVKYGHPDFLLAATKDNNFHVYILDIVMPMVNGLELGKAIRRFDREAQIIYATTEPQFALQAYAASPINYILKPVDRQQLFNTLNLAISKVDIAEEQTITVKTSDGLRMIKLSDIACCEYQGHTVIFNLINGNEIISKTIRENFLEYCEPILKDKHFIRCHTSFVVNMRRVVKFSKESFTLRSNKIVPISAKKYPIVRDAYMDYLMAKEDRS
ncbi:MAG: LytTR family transcriptional regulator [Clostridiales bacterium 38-18]|nr:MAG: LytTR family transcriptional regulator [Clostridiales bacterium 38-18]